MLEELARVRTLLGAPGASARVAALATQMASASAPERRQAHVG